MSATVGSRLRGNDDIFKRVFWQSLPPANPTASAVSRQRRNRYLQSTARFVFHFRIFHVIE